MNFAQLQEKLGIKIKDKELFLTAFTHTSYLNEKKQTKKSNEKLEFLGDSIISFVVADYLYRNYPTLSEGDYTDIRGKLVCRDTLGKTAENLGFGKFLRLSKGEEKIGGRKNLTILADTFEAIVGAIYLQSGFEKAAEFVKKTIITPYIEKIIENQSYISAKTRLQEYIQKKYHMLPSYKILATKGPEHKKTYRVAVYFKNQKLAEGTGNSKKRAEEQAAENTLKKISKNQLEI